MQSYNYVVDDWVWKTYTFGPTEAKHHPGHTLIAFHIKTHYIDILKMKNSQKFSEQQPDMQLSSYCWQRTYLNQSKH